MSDDSNLKICIECRAEVPSAAEACPECGYPFDDASVTRCRTCGSTVVADVVDCPVCGQPVARQKTATERPSFEQAVQRQPEQQIDLSAVSAQLQQAVSSQPQAGLDAASYADLSARLDLMRNAVQELANAVQANSRASDDIARMVLDSNGALKQSIHEQQTQNQQAMQQSLDLIKVVYESLGAGVGTPTNLAQVASELKIGLVELASQQNVGSNMIITAINETAAEAAKRTPGGLPRSIRWLDYMFIAVIMMVIFTVVNMMVVAYMVRIMLAD